MWKVIRRGVLANKVRFALTGISVLLGVAFISGTLVLTSTIGRSGGHSGAQKACSPPKMRRPMLVLPEPEGPTTTPICHFPSSMSSSASIEKSQPLSALNRLFTRAAR